METRKRLYRSKTNKVLAGVCGGVAEYIGADPTVIRIVWVLLTLMGGSGVLLYIIAYLVMPESPLPPEGISAESDSKMRFVVGTLLVLLGIILLFDTLDLFSFRELWEKSWEYLLPIVLILVGMALLFRRSKTVATTTSAYNQENEQHTSSVDTQGSEPELSNSTERLMRSVQDKKLLGICGGIAEYFHIDSTVVRLLYILFTFVTGGVGFILYFLLALVLPKAPLSHEQPR